MCLSDQASPLASPPLLKKSLPWPAREPRGQTYPSPWQGAQPWWTHMRSADPHQPADPWVRAGAKSRIEGQTAGWTLGQDFYITVWRQNSFFCGKLQSSVFQPQLVRRGPPILRKVLSFIESHLIAGVSYLQNAFTKAPRLVFDPLSGHQSLAAVTHETVSVSDCCLKCWRREWFVTQHCRTSGWRIQKIKTRNCRLSNSVTATWCP